MVYIDCQPTCSRQVLWIWLKNLRIWSFTLKPELPEIWWLHSLIIFKSGRADRSNRIQEKRLNPPGSRREAGLETRRKTNWYGLVQLKHPLWLVLALHLVYITISIHIYISDSVGRYLDSEEKHQLESWDWRRNVKYVLIAFYTFWEDSGPGSMSLGITTWCFPEKRILPQW